MTQTTRQAVVVVGGLQPADRRPKGRRLRLFAAVLLASAFSAPAQSQWRRLDSPNFLVMGDVSAGDLRSVAVRFEGFRETLGRVLNERVTLTAVPTVVLVFSSDRAFTPFRPFFQGKRVEMSGVFVPRRDVNYIAMVKDADDERLRVLFHEYAHLIISNTGQRVPVWLNEGLAEYYSTFELERGGRSAVIGRIIPSHILELNERKHLTLTELLNVTHQSPLYNEGSRRSVFYAQAWALTHLIIQGQPSRAPQLAMYLTQLSRGAAPEAAWQQAFGAQNLAQELDSYIRRQMYTATEYRFSDRIASFEGQARPVPAAEIEAYLADFLAQTSQMDDAEKRLAAAEKLDSSSAAVDIMSARLGIARNERADSRQLIRKLGPIEDWFLNYLAGVIVASSVDGANAPTPADVDLARAFFTKARQDRPESANAMVRMATLEYRSPAGPTAETRAALERARAIAPGRHEYAFLLAQVLTRMSEFQAARDLLGPMMTPAVPPEVRESAKSLMGYIASIENSRAARSTDSPASRPGAPASRSAGSTTSNASSTVTETNPTQPAGVTVRPFYRELKPGEQRFEGTLERIDCVVKVGVTFQVKSGTDLVAVTSPDFTSVEFLTYRDDLKGNIECGPQTPALRVYVTWRPGTTAGSKVAVAIEFLPKTGG